MSGLKMTMAVRLRAHENTDTLSATDGILLTSEPTAHTHLAYEWITSLINVSITVF